MTKGEETRQRIIRKAAPLFNRRGYEGSSMGEIMEATQLEKGGIYRHFSGKEELAAEAFDYAWSEAIKTRTHDLDQIENSVDRLKQFITNFAERRPSVTGGCPLLNTAVDSDDGNALLRVRARKALEQWQAWLKTIIAAGIRKGEIRPEVAGKKIADVIISSLEGALMMGRLQQSELPLQNAAEHLHQYLEGQLRAFGKA
jgi:TetR/AcrR family transcriptional regulator, transcriptional repressor for nem operon